MPQLPCGEIGRFGGVLDVKMGGGCHVVCYSSTCKNLLRFEREGNLVWNFLKLYPIFYKKFFVRRDITRFLQVQLGWCKSRYLHGVFKGCSFHMYLGKSLALPRQLVLTGICPSNVKGVKCGAIFKLHVKFKVVHWKFDCSLVLILLFLFPVLVYSTSHRIIDVQKMSAVFVRCFPLVKKSV